MEASRHIRRFVRRQPILAAAALGALVTMALVPPSPTYLDYLDLHVLVLLFCLMTCVAGLQRAGLFSWVATLMLGTPRSARFVSAVLAGLCFVGSMFVTNDVALITFVPLGIYLFRVAKQERLVARVAVIQTLAANMGSMLTPIGNPQNLFLCSRYGIEPFSLLIVVAPFALLSLVMIAAFHLSVPSIGLEAQLPGRTENLERRDTAVFGLLFVVSVLAVLNVVPLWLAFAVVLVATVAFRVDVIRRVDYALLATFVCFFVLSGNLAHLDAAAELLHQLMVTSPFAVALATSQVISNVPAAVLLAPFAGDWQQLLLGVDIGGLGTPVASLASLITLQLYRKAHLGSFGRLLLLFLGANALLLGANCALWALLYL